MATIENLPDDVMIDILSRLPRDSLLQTKAVCISWYILNYDSALRFKHVLLKRLVMNKSGKREIKFSILKFPLALDRPVSVVDVDFPFNDDLENPQDLEIHGRSHGLVCLTDRTNIFLSNPTTGEFRKLPPSILLLPEPFSEDTDHFTYPKPVGFGYDAKSGDFKVVRVVDFNDEFAQFDHKRVEIYNLTTDRWTEIESPVSAHVFWMPSFEMYHKGTYYWWANSDEGAEIIQSFDMSEEVFGEISVPESFVEDGGFRSMGVWKGSVVLFHYPRDGNEKSFDIWEMEKDESGSVSWSKILTIGPLPGIHVPLLFLSSDELLMEANEGQLISYNVISQQIKTHKIEDQPIEGRSYNFQATVFVESLQSVEGRNNLFNFEF